MQIWATPISVTEAGRGKRLPRLGKSHKDGARAVGSRVPTGGKIIRALFRRDRSTEPVRPPATYSSRAMPLGLWAPTWCAAWYARRSWHAPQSWLMPRSRWGRIVPSSGSRPRRRASVFYPPMLHWPRTGLFSSVIFTTIQADGQIR